MYLKITSWELSILILFCKHYGNAIFECSLNRVLHEHQLKCIIKMYNVIKYQMTLNEHSNNVTGIVFDHKLWRAFGSDLWFISNISAATKPCSTSAQRSFLPPASKQTNHRKQALVSDPD